MTWARSAVHRLCGGRCDRTIGIGDPVLFVTSAQLARCVDCAKREYQTEPPADLAPLQRAEAPREQPFAAVRDLAKRFDVKQAQTGEGR